MTTTETRPASAYPPPVAELLPSARELANRLGELPSRNRLMRELRIGANKAATLLTELATDTAQRPSVTEVDQPTEPIPTTDDRPAELAPLDTTGQPAPAADRAAEVRPVEGAPARVDRVPVRRPVRSWPVLLLALPAFVAIWSGWVGLGGLTGFGVVHPLPGIWDSLAVNTAITLPIGMETYAAFALRAWLSGSAPTRARRFAKWSAIGSLALGAAGQVAYHLMTATGMTAAPWPITTVVACLPVAVLGMGAALAHLLHDTDTGTHAESGSESESGSEFVEVTR